MFKTYFKRSIKVNILILRKELNCVLYNLVDNNNYLFLNKSNIRVNIIKYKLLYRNYIILIYFTNNSYFSNASISNSLYKLFIDRELSFSYKDY